MIKYPTLRSLVICFLFPLLISQVTPKLWNKEGKSVEEINSAYYCAKNDLYKFVGSNMRQFRALLKVIIILYFSVIISVD